MKTKARKSRRKVGSPTEASGQENKRTKVGKKPDLFAQISRCVDEKIRPFIQMDGGDIELVELTKKNVLKVRLQGACCGCPAAGITLSYGVQAAIDEEFPEEDIQVLLIP